MKGNAGLPENNSYWVLFLLVLFSLFVFLKAGNQFEIFQNEEGQSYEKDENQKLGKPPVVKLTTKKMGRWSHEKPQKSTSFHSQASREEVEDALSQGDIPERTYIVKEGDVLSAISLEVYGSVRQTNFLKEANSLKSVHNLSIGQVLRIPNITQNKPSGSLDSESDYFVYSVLRDQSAWMIAEKFYGHGKLYTVVIQDNPEVFSKGKNDLPEGSKIKIRKDFN